MTAIILKQMDTGQAKECSMADKKEPKPKIPEQARRIIEALVNTPPVKKPAPRKKGG